jgi:hypothetical protein
MLPLSNETQKGNEKKSEEKIRKDVTAGPTLTKIG